MQRLNNLIGRTIPWLTLGMVLTTFAIVVLRYVFERGWVWMQEIVLYMHALTFLLASGYALARDAHVRVDILYRPASPQRHPAGRPGGCMGPSSPPAISGPARWRGSVGRAAGS